MSSCIEIPQYDYNIVLLSLPPWIGLIVMAIGAFVTIMVCAILYNCRRRVYRDGQWCPGRLCTCIPCICCTTSKLKERNSSTISLMLDSSISEASNTEPTEGSERPLLTGLLAEQPSSADKEDSFSRHTLIIDDCEEEGDYESDTESKLNVNISKSKQKGKMQKSLPFSALLCLPNKDEALAQLYTEDKKAFDILEYSMFEELHKVLHVMVQYLAQQVTAALKASDKKWREELECFVKDMFCKTKKRWQAICSLVMEKEDLSIPDTLQADLHSVSAYLTDHICLTLEDADVIDNEKMVFPVLQEFLNNWAAFECLQAEIKLKQVKQLERNMKLRKHILVTLYDERVELIQELLQYNNKQLAQLDRVQHEVHTEKLQSMRTNLYDTWEYTLDSFHIELRRECCALSLQLQPQLNMEEEHGLQLLQKSITEKKDALLRGHLSLSEFVTDYCELTRTYFKGKSARVLLELQLVGSQFSTLVENSGVKILKDAIKTEKKLYEDYLQRNSWITPQVSQSIKGNLTRMKGLRGLLKKLRGKQRANLQALVKQKAAKEVSEETFCGAEITSHQASLQEVIEIQTDLRESDCQHLVDHCAARLKMFEVQLELSKLRQERRLQEVLEVKMDQLSNNLIKETNGISSTHEASLIAKLRFQKEEQRLCSLHESACVELKRKLEEETKSALLSEHFIFQKQIEKLRRKQERVLSLVNKKELALNALKSKLLDKLSHSKDKDVGERIIHQHQADTELLSQTITKTKDYQNLVLTQKLQARKIEKKQEKEKELKQQQPPQQPYRPGSAKAFVSGALVNWLHEVRHKKAIAALEAELENDEKMTRLKMMKRFQAESKLEHQVHVTEAIVKLASVLNMTHSELENELRKSVLEQSGGTDQETCSLVTNSALDLLNHAY